MVEILKGLNTGLAFLLELAMLVAFRYWGFHGEKSILVKWLMGLGLPIVAVIVWGIFLAPQSTFRLRTIPDNLLSLLLFLLAATALLETGHVILAITFASIAVLNRIWIVVWKQW